MDSCWARIICTLLSTDYLYANWLIVSFIWYVASSQLTDRDSECTMQLQDDDDNNNNNINNDNNKW